MHISILELRTHSRINNTYCDQERILIPSVMRSHTSHTFEIGIFYQTDCQGKDWKARHRQDCKRRNKAAEDEAKAKGGRDNQKDI